MTFIHIITLIALKRVEEDSIEPLLGEAVTRTIWEKPCNFTLTVAIGLSAWHGVPPAQFL